MTREKKRLLFVELTINPPGGGGCVAAWALQTLRDDYAVDLFAWMPVDFDAINRYYGTALYPKDFSIWNAPGWLNWIVSHDPEPWNTQLCILDADC